MSNEEVPVAYGQDVRRSGPIVAAREVGVTENDKRRAAEDLAGGIFWSFRFFASAWAFPAVIAGELWRARPKNRNARNLLAPEASHVVETTRAPVAHNEFAVHLIRSWEVQSVAALVKRTGVTAQEAAQLLREFSPPSSVRRAIRNQSQEVKA